MEEKKIERTFYMNYTWNLDDIYPSWEAWEQDFQKMKRDVNHSELSGKNS